MTDNLIQLHREAGDILLGNILPFWEGMKDSRGGFYGEAGFNGEIRPEAGRGCVLNARILWAFSAAGHALGSARILSFARWAAKYFAERFIDKDFGGVYWALHANGSPSDDKKQLYAQAFAIYALSEYYMASGSGDALDCACRLFRCVEENFRDRQYGGYSEALSREFTPLSDMSLSDNDINAPKTMNSHLHLLEAYANLYRACPSAEVREATMSLLELMKDRITAPDGHMFLYFERDWTPIPAGFSCGHDIEASWLVLECAMGTGDEEMLESIKALSLRLARAGNGLFHPSGKLETTEEWWVYAESLVGNLWLYRHHGCEEGLANAMQIWNFIKDGLVDYTNGEWFLSLSPDGKPRHDMVKAGFWKCPYHNTRMCLQAMALAKPEPVSFGMHP